MELANPLPPATVDQQNYVDLAAYYAGRGVVCYGNEQWPEAATHFGSAMESLLRIRFGKGKLVKLVEKFDNDPLFDAVELHDANGKVCSTCVAGNA